MAFILAQTVNHFCSGYISGLNFLTQVYILPDDD
jgi:hypothetical protein